MTVASVHWSALDTEYERWCIPSTPRLLKDTRLTPLAIWDTDELLDTAAGEDGDKGCFDVHTEITEGANNPPLQQRTTATLSL